MIMKKIILFFIMLFQFLITYSIYPDDGITERINNFWNFISQNEMAILGINKQYSPLYNEIYNQIQLVNENIWVMLGNEIKNTKKDLIITCGGNSNYFELCDRIVKSSPGFSHLNTISLFPPLEKIEPFIYENIVLNIKDVNVHFDNDNDLLFILSEKHRTILSNDTSGQLYNIYMQMLFIMTQQILGERIFGEKIKSTNISLVNISIPNIPLIELKKYIK
jgi:hypothetical protein